MLHFAPLDDLKARSKVLLINFASNHTQVILVAIDGKLWRDVCPCDRLWRSYEYG